MSIFPSPVTSSWRSMPVIVAALVVLLAAPIGVLAQEADPLPAKRDSLSIDQTRPRFSQS